MSLPREGCEMMNEISSSLDVFPAAESGASGLAA